jgi:hypothetical protein
MEVHGRRRGRAWLVCAWALALVSAASCYRGFASFPVSRPIVQDDWDDVTYAFGHPTVSAGDTRFIHLDAETSSAFTMMDDGIVTLWCHLPPSEDCHGDDIYNMIILNDHLLYAARTQYVYSGIMTDLIPVVAGDVFQLASYARADDPENAGGRCDFIMH